jgi:hypothetical protein
MSEDTESNVKICVPLEEVIAVWLLIEKLHEFLHQPLHYDENPRVATFLRDPSSGVYKDLHKAYYETVWNWLPEAKQKEMENRDYDADESVKWREP